MKVFTVEVGATSISGSHTYELGYSLANVLCRVIARQIARSTEACACSGDEAMPA